MILKTTWHQNNFSLGTSTSLNETNSSTKVDAYIGLIRIGEMLSTQNDISSLKTYWLLNSSDTETEAFSINTLALAQISTVTDMFYVKSVLNIKSQTRVSGGNGTKELPYIIE